MIVPTEYVTLENISGDVINVVEKHKSTLTCKTSAGRPSANITWAKISKEGLMTYFTDDMTYTAETQLEGNLTVVTSSIELEPVRDDNDTRIICEATNRKLHGVRKEITLHVQCTYLTCFCLYCIVKMFSHLISFLGKEYNV